MGFENYNNSRRRDWFCPICKEKFSSRAALRLHQKNVSHFAKPTGRFGGSKKIDYICPFCKKPYTSTVSGRVLHIKSCIQNPNRVDGALKGFHRTEEQNKHLSYMMKKAHAEGRAFSWADLRKNQEPSYPEKWLANVLTYKIGLVDNKDFIREVKFHTFSLDFVINNKYVIEMDGEQHKRSEYQKDCDKRKDALLAQEGYYELRLDWTQCYKNQEKAILIIKKFLGV